MTNNDVITPETLTKLNSLIEAYSHSKKAWAVALDIAFNSKSSDGKGLSVERAKNQAQMELINEDIDLPEVAYWRMRAAMRDVRGSDEEDPEGQM